MKLLAPLLIALALPASAVAEQVPAAPALPDGGCTYSWPAGTVAKVTEAVSKKGNDAVQTYTLSLTPRDDGNFEVTYSDFRFTKFQGQAVTPAMEKDLAPVVAMAAAIPTTVVSSSGTFVEIVGFDAMIDKVVNFLVEQGEVSKEEIGMVEAMMRSPGMQQQLHGNAQAIWNGWIGDWVGLEVPVGDVVDSAIPVNPAAPDGPKQSVKLENVGPVADHPGKLHFRLTIALEGEAARSLLEPMLAPMMAQVPAAERDEMLKAMAGLDGSIVRSVEAITDPATLQAAWVKTVKTTHVKLDALGMDNRDVESHEYTFEWVPAAASAE